jgi:hypothetical protein
VPSPGSYTKRLIRVGSLFVRCDDDGLCGYSAAAEGLRRSLGIKITCEEIFNLVLVILFLKKQREWTDDSFLCG